MKGFVIFIMLFLASCSYQATNTEVATENEEKKETTNSNKEINATRKTSEMKKISSPPETKFSLPEVIKFGVYAATRNSENKNINGQQIAPFTEVEFINIYWKDKPQPGEKVTVIPLKTNFAPLNLSIKNAKETKAEYSENCGKDENEIFWKINLEKLKNKELLEMKPVIKDNSEEYPFEAFVIYPVVAFARQLKQDELTKKDLPKGSEIKEVTAAIDLTNDGMPDLIELKYCCERIKSRDDKTCDYSDCGEWWKKVDGKWEKTFDWSPC